MEIKDLNDIIIEEAMHASASHQDVTSFSNFRRGWLSAIRFAVKVEKADHICTQCGKLIELEDTKYDNEGVPFCKKCFNKVFNP